MTKDELWDLIQKAKTARKTARKAWVDYHTTLTGYNHKEHQAALTAQINSEWLEEKAINAVKQEIEG